MKFKKSIIALAVAAGTGVLVTAPANAVEFFTSVGGNIRVEAQSVSVTETPASADKKEPVHSTLFGGDEDESTTGEDTYLQVSHQVTSDDGSTTGKGFLRFAADGKLRINVESTSEVGNHRGELKAEWEAQSFGGAKDRSDLGSITERDQFAKLTHISSGLYYKIGREQWLGNQKGYTSDFLSATKSYADAGNGDNRFAAHALGWSGSGVNVALLIQRNNAGSSSALPNGFVNDVQVIAEEVRTITAPPPTATGSSIVTNQTISSVMVDPTGGLNQIAVSGFGLLLGYSDDTVDLALNLGSGGAEDPRATSKQEDETSFTELQLALTLGNYKPFFNYGSSTYKNQRPTNSVTSTATRDQSGKETVDTNSRTITGTTTATVEDSTTSGWNLGLSVGLGASDLVIAYGSASHEDKVNKAGDYDRSGFDLIWATNQDPLKVSLAYASDKIDIKAAGAPDTTTNKYGVRLDFGF